MGATSSHSYVPVPTSSVKKNNEREMVSVHSEIHIDTNIDAHLSPSLAEMKSYIQKCLVPPKHKLLLEHPNDAYTFMFNAGLLDASFLDKKVVCANSNTIIPSFKVWMAYSLEITSMHFVEFDALTGFDKKSIIKMYNDIFNHQSLCLKKRMSICVGIMFKVKNGARDFNCRDFTTHNEIINFLSRLNLFIQFTYNKKLSLPTKDFVDETEFFNNSNEGVCERFVKYSGLIKGNKIKEEMSTNIRYNHAMKTTWNLVFNNNKTLKESLQKFLEDVQTQLQYEKHMVKAKYDIVVNNIIYHILTYDELRNVEKALIQLISEEDIAGDNSEEPLKEKLLPEAPQIVPPPVENISLSVIVDKEI
jgi:hypothetical protein